MSDLLNTLKRAHETAQCIPDLEAELREVLAGMGYTLGKISPFLDDQAKPADNMTDWRNWRNGDRVEYFGCSRSFIGAECFIGAITDESARKFRVHKAGTEYFIWAYPHEIRFLSRREQQRNRAGE
jgi:hypothetical protein